MNFLSLFVAIPVLMMLVLLVSRNVNAIRAVMVTGATLLLGLAVMLVCMYIGERSAGNGAEMLFCADRLWFAPLNIHYAVGVDGIS
ncbi:MAG: NADH-quinone oxidoreductase subunit M, partial [Odoribacter sp.]|nr:NADH-quinone oxidoreductase subunit M [Odoribacter sp.]